MKVSSFDYELPTGRIAQEPVERRDGSRLMVLGRHDGSTEHRLFHDLPELLAPGDLVVVNDTRVRAARLWGRKESGGQVEVTLVEPVAREATGRFWRALIRASRTPRPGAVLLCDADLRVKVAERSGAAFIVELEHPSGEPEAVMDRVGSMPLPPYIRRERHDRRHDLDRERYQTVFADRCGAVAAPTAGLHFTPEVLDDLAKRGIEHARLTLHVGLGTFAPVRSEAVEEHRIHSEHVELPEGVAEAVRRARERGGRVIAVGTTVVRALEGSAAAHDGRVEPMTGSCDLFIYPGFRFRAVDALVTNFHLPRSTLLMLVAAFAGRERVLAAYREAVETGYRFYSYGDAMLVIDTIPASERA